MLMLRLAGAAALAAACTAAIAASEDEQMQRLALDSGCTLCHARTANADASAPPPPAPAWNTIASRYRGQGAVEDKLVAAVVQGSASDRRHWRGSMLKMPPNAVEVGESDARKLVRWILRQ